MKNSDTKSNQQNTHTKKIIYSLLGRGGNDTKSIQHPVTAAPYQNKHRRNKIIRCILCD